MYRKNRLAFEALEPRSLLAAVWAEVDFTAVNDAATWKHAVSAAPSNGAACEVDLSFVDQDFEAYLQTRRPAVAAHA